MTKSSKQPLWRSNFFEGVPSPAGGLLILMPLIFELSEIEVTFNYKTIIPYFTVIVAILLVSKIPTLSLKKISISPKSTIFILLGIGLIFIGLLLYTFEMLLLFGLGYLISIPVSFLIYYNQTKKDNSQITDEEHEDIL